MNTQNYAASMKAFLEEKIDAAVDTVHLQAARGHAREFLARVEDHGTTLAKRAMAMQKTIDGAGKVTEAQTKALEIVTAAAPAETLKKLQDEQAATPASPSN